MAALDFPASSSSPWTDPNGSVWVWNGTGWVQKIPYPGTSTAILNTAAPTLAAGVGETGSDISDILTLDTGTWLNVVSYNTTWYMQDAIGVKTQITPTGNTFTRSGSNVDQAIYVEVAGVDSFGNVSSAIGTNFVGKRKLTFLPQNSIQGWSVPASVYSLDVKMWGASDQHGNYAWGGFTKGTVAVNPGDDFVIIVGLNDTQWAGNGNKNSNAYHAGGMSAMFFGDQSIDFTSGADQAKMLIGAGGAGACCDVWPSTGCGGDGGGDTGWYGFGTHGNGGGCGNYPATNWNWTSHCMGSQTSGGGNIMKGGDASHCSYWYGPGGGGYWGGCNGGCSGSCHLGGGGGGSGYIGNSTHPQAAISNGYTYIGSTNDPYTESDYIAGVAKKNDGGDGKGMLLIYF